MRLLKLKARDFMSHGSTEIDLAHVPAAVITGANGAGKSSLIDLIGWTLWGETRAGTDDVVRLGQLQATGEVEFEAGGQRYRVARTRKLNGRGTSTLEFEVADAACPSGWRSLAGANLRDTETRIAGVVGAYDLACSTWLSRQGQADQFARATPSERRTIIGRLLGLEKWGVYRARSLELGRATERELDLHEPRRQALQAIIDTLPGRTGDLESRRSGLATAEAEERSAADAVAVAAAERNTRAAEHATIREARAVLAAERQAERSAHDKVQAREAAVSALSDEIEALELVDGAWTPEHEAALVKAREAEQAAVAAQDTAAERGAEQADKVRDAETAVACIREEIAAESVAVRETWQAERSRLSDALMAAQARQADARDAHQAAQHTVADALAKAREEWLVRKSEAQANVTAAERTEQVALQAVEAADRDAKVAERDAALLGQVPCGGTGEFSGCQFLVRAAAAKQDAPLLAEAAAKARERHDAAQRSTAAARAELAGLPASAPAIAPATMLFDLENARIAAEDATFAATKASDALLAHGSVPPSVAPSPALAARLADADRAVQAAVAAKSEAAEAWRQARDRVAALRADIAARESRRAKGREVAQKIETARARLAAAQDELKREQADLLNAIEAVNARLAAAQEQRDLDAEIATLDIAVAERTRDRDAVTRRVADAASLVREAERLVAEAEKAVADMDALLASTADARRRAADLVTLAQAYQDVPQLIVETVIPDIEATANRLLAKVSQTGLSISIRTQRALKSDKERVAETLDLIVRDVVGERPYESYSGGERFRVDWALRVALAHVLSARAGLDLRTLVVDEGFGALDPAGIAGFASMLPATADLFGLCLVISHVPELAEAFPARLEVVKTAAGSVAEWR